MSPPSALVLQSQRHLKWPALDIIEAVMMIGQRNKEPRSSLLVTCNQRIGIPVQKSPLSAQILISKF